jgi:small subunit ribosomal protein S1
VGDSLKVKILSIDRDNKKIAASVREVKCDPWQTLDIERGDIIEAIVTNKTNVGFFLKIADGIEGILHNKALAWNRLDRDTMKDSLSVGDTVRVVLLEIDKEKRKMIFSIKHLDSEQ